MLNSQLLETIKTLKIKKGLEAVSCKARGVVVTPTSSKSFFVLEEENGF